MNGSRSTGITRTTARMPRSGESLPCQPKNVSKFLTANPLMSFSLDNASTGLQQPTNERLMSRGQRTRYESLGREETASTEIVPSWRCCEDFRGTKTFVLLHCGSYWNQTSSQEH